MARFRQMAKFCTKTTVKLIVLTSHLEPQAPSPYPGLQQLALRRAVTTETADARLDMPTCSRPRKLYRGLFSTRGFGKSFR
jgi:hypothetical protein